MTSVYQYTNIFIHTVYKHYQKLILKWFPFGVVVREMAFLSLGSDQKSIIIKSALKTIKMALK